MRRVILGGITGHLGAEISRQLAGRGVEVHGLTRSSRAAAGSGAHGARLHVVGSRTESVTSVFEVVRPDTVIQVASLYRREHRGEDVAPLVQANVLFGCQLLEGARLTGCKRFLTAGSFFQHFGSDECRALNLYAATKQAFESILAYYADEYGMSAAALTLYEVYSEADSRPKLVPAIASALSSGTPLRLPSEEFWLDLVHVEDVAGAFLHVADLLEHEGEAAGQVRRYCVCSGKDTAGSELISLFERLSGRTMNVTRGDFVMPRRSMSRPWRGATPPGWAPRISLEEGISRVVSRYR